MSNKPPENSVAGQSRELGDRAQAIGLPWNPSMGHCVLFDLMPYYAMKQRKYAELRKWCKRG